MPTYNRLTDRTLATGVTLNDLIHIVITGDTSQNPAGSSYKATIRQLANIITGATGTSGSAGTAGTSGTNGSSGVNGTSGTNGSSGINGTNGSNGTSGTSGVGTGSYLPLSGGTITGSTAYMYFNPNELGGRINISGFTSLPIYQASISPYLSYPTASVQMGMRSWDNVSNPGYGKVGDGFIYASNETNGLNIINRQGTGTEDYI
jgi:hypothetical protein